jgi:hypothetical protein
MRSQNVRGGFYFHPSDEDLPPHPTDKDPSAGTRCRRDPEQKKPLDVLLPGYSHSGFAVSRAGRSHCCKDEPSAYGIFAEG